MIKKFLAVFILTILFMSCTKVPSYEDLEVQDLDMAITLFDVSANWNSYNTFAIADTFSVVSQGTITHDFTNITAITQIKNAIESQMISRGYTQVGVNDSPDLAFTVTLV